MIVLSTDDLDESIRFYSETLGMSLKFRDGAHFAALDGGSVTVALATAVDHPIPGQLSSVSRPLTSTPQRRLLRPVVAAL
jgi:lactoylglutathione lyase